MLIEHVGVSLPALVLCFFLFLFAQLGWSAFTVLSTCLGVGLCFFVFLMLRYGGRETASS